MLAGKRNWGLSFVEVDVFVKGAKVIVCGKERLLLFKLPGLKSFSGGKAEVLTLFSLSANEDDVENILLLLLFPAGVGEVDKKFRP